MDKNNSYDRDNYSGPDMFQGDNNLYTAFLNDDVITEQIDHSKNTYPHNYMKTAYDQQRRDRLTDVVDDYLNDDDKTAMDLYEDIKNSLTENRNYFAKQKQKCDAILSMLNGDNNPEFISE